MVIDADRPCREIKMLFVLSVVCCWPPELTRRCHPSASFRHKSSANVRSSHTRCHQGNGSSRQPSKSVDSVCRQYHLPGECAVDVEWTPARPQKCDNQIYLQPCQYACRGTVSGHFPLSVREIIAAYATEPGASLRFPPDGRGSVGLREGRCPPAAG